MIDAGIDAFWTWWGQTAAGARLAAAIEARNLDEALLGEVNGKVQGIHPKLIWELTPGASAPHAFCLSSSGDPELRRLTERWLRAAPTTDAAWEFHPAKRGAPSFANARLQIAEHSVLLGEMRFTATLDPIRELLNVTSFHPAFAAMPEDMRALTTFVTLDRILGEDIVQRWFGAIRTSVEPLAQGGDFAMLSQAVGVLSRDATGERFTDLQGQSPDGRPMSATINLALKRIDHLACDTHVVVDVALRDPTPDGMPTDEELDALSDIEDELEDMITGDAAYLGRETVQGRRTLHWFVTPDHPVRPALEAWAAGHADRDVRLTWAHDPRWQTAERFR